MKWLKLSLALVLTAGAFAIFWLGNGWLIWVGVGGMTLALFGWFSYVNSGVRDGLLQHPEPADDLKRADVWTPAPDDRGLGLTRM